MVFFPLVPNNSRGVKGFRGKGGHSRDGGRDKIYVKKKPLPREDTKKKRK